VEIFGTGQRPKKRIYWVGTSEDGPILLSYGDELPSYTREKSMHAPCTGKSGVNKEGDLTRAVHKRRMGVSDFFGVLGAPRAKKQGD